MAKSLVDILGNEPVSENEEDWVAKEYLKKLTDTSSKDLKVSIRMNSNIYNKLKEIAKQKGLTVSAIITMLIKQFIDQQEAK